MKKLLCLFVLLPGLCFSQVIFRQAIIRQAILCKAISGGGGGSVFTLINSTGVSGVNSVDSTNPPVNTTGASLLVIPLINSSGTPTVVGEFTNGVSIANTWILTTVVSGTPPCYYFYCTNPIVGPAHKVVISAIPFSGISFNFLAYNKAGGAAAFDGVSAGGQGNWFSGTSVQPGAFTPGTPNDLVIATVGFDIIDGTGISIDSGFTKRSSPQVNTGIGQGLWSADKIKVSDSTAENPAFSQSQGLADSVRESIYFK